MKRPRSMTPFRLRFVLVSCYETHKTGTHRWGSVPPVYRSLEVTDDHLSQELESVDRCLRRQTAGSRRPSDPSIRLNS